MRSVYGPYRSWRMGKTLGVDPICRQPKACNMKCVYCRLGCGGIMITERGRFVDEGRILDEAREALEKDKVDIVEFRGTGEPFLAKNIQDMVSVLRTLTDAPFSVVTNGSMLGREDVQDDLEIFDYVVVKFDAYDDASMRQVNRPHFSVTFDKIVSSIRRAVEESDTDVILQVMMFKGNVANAGRIADLVRDIGPVRVFISTPQCPDHPGLSKKDMAEVVGHFHDLDVRTIYDEQ